MKHGKQPRCYVVAGPNGAGKTTFALKYLPRIASCYDFINADEIAKAWYIHGVTPLLLFGTVGPPAATGDRPQPRNRYGD